EVVGYPGIAFAGMSEEHGHLLAAGAHRLKPGDKLRVVPNHACTCVNMHELMYAYRGEKVEATWQIIARGRIR
ncbi:MAG TPA: hypothetical protein VGS41_07575, partial [Chthonomonadales bacterium]|nr:hypothetical protein [Chthonomonadales bacterium]